MRRRLPRPKSMAQMRKFLRRYEEEAAMQQRGSALTAAEWADAERAARRIMVQHDRRIEMRLTGRRDVLTD